MQSATALGRALRDNRRGKRLTQQQLAELSGVAQATISNVERGVSSVTLPTLLRILAALQLELILQGRDASDAVSAWQAES